MSPKDNKTRAMVKETLSKGTDHIGTIVMWSIDGVDVQKDELESLYGQHQLDAFYLPPEIKVVSAFRKSVKKISSKCPDHLFRSISKSENEVVIGIVREDVDRHQKNLDYDVECKVTLNAKDPDNLSMTVEPKGHKQGIEVAKEFRRLKDRYISRDIYSMLKTNIVEKMFGISLRDTGGVYFVTPEFTSDLKKHKSVIRELGNSELILLQVNSDPDSKEDMSRQAKKSLEAELKDITLELEKFVSEKKDVSENMMKLRLDKFKELREKADMYSEILDIKSSEIKTGLKDAKNILQNLFDSTEKRKEDEKTLKEKRPTVNYTDRIQKRTVKRIRKTV